MGNKNIPLPIVDDLDCAETKVIEHFALADFSEIASIRRNHFRSYSAQLHDIKGLRFMYELEGYDIPQSSH